MTTQSEFPLEEVQQKSDTYAEKILDKIQQLDEKNRDFIVASVATLLRQIVRSPGADSFFPVLLEQLSRDPAIFQIVQEAALQKSDAGILSFERAVEDSHWICARLLLGLPNAKAQIQARDRKMDALNITNCIINSGDDKLIEQYLRYEDPNLKVSNDLSVPLSYRSTALMDLLRTPTIKTDLFKSVVAQSLFEIDFNVLYEKDKRGLLHFAAMRKDLSVIDLLLDKGLSPHVKDVYGHTPIDYALFVGDSAVASRLSGIPKETLEKDPRFKNTPSRMDHGGLVQNILAYIKIEHQKNKDIDIQLALPDINEGICNGWSMLAALTASQPGNTEANIQRFYKMMDVMCKWDKKEASLATIPDEFKNEFKSLDEMFHHLTHEIYWFYQQHSASFGISPSDREKQLEIISDKIRIKQTAGFELADLSQEEAVKVLNAYKVIADNSMIDVGSQRHTTFYFQKSQSALYYFDPNPNYALPKYEDYQEACEKTIPFLVGNIHGVGYFHCNPDSMPAGLQEKADRITDGLIRTLIIEHPKRKHQIESILCRAGYLDSSHMLDRLLNHVAIKAMLTQNILVKIADEAVDRKSYKSIYVLYQHRIDLNLLSGSMLAAFLQTAIQNEDEKMFDEVKQVFDKVSEKEKRSASHFLSDVGSSSLSSMMQFDLAGKHGAQSEPTRATPMLHAKPINQNELKKKLTHAQDKPAPVNSAEKKRNRKKK